MKNLVRTTAFTRLLSMLLAALLSACATTRPALPPGEIPDQGPPTVEEEQTGHQVFSQLVERFPLSRDNEQIFRIRGIVEKLTAPLNDPDRIWHVYVLEGAEIKNAAATRGNYIFVWSGLLDEVKNDDELATVLAHEISHILIGHTRPEPTEQINRALSQIASQTARQAVFQVGGAVGSLAGLAGILAELIFDAALVNPTSQAKEHEADQVGVFLMADACFNPQAASDFWSRAPGGVDLGYLNVFSTHPRSEERLTALEELLPLAITRYTRQCRRSQGNFINESIDEVWQVISETSIREAPGESAQVLQVLKPKTKVRVNGRAGQWLSVSEPTPGFVFGPDCSPITA